ncbi:hypothetical protein PybrP1_004030 [[Pythium] brassicae (nom. inval.)]|nr:hypothetical protein PybrP1_004030 [[Pythium] brassicae (nom. inval.)]
MKRKLEGNDDGADSNAVAAAATTAEAEASNDGDKRVILLDDAITVEAFFDQDCDLAAQAILDELAAELARLPEDKVGETATVLAEASDAFEVAIKCVAGPYKGHLLALQLDSHTHRSCLIGRSTGRKFRAPNGLSMPKDPELSTTHAQLRIEPGGRIFFVDLDSTNGSLINGESVEPHEPKQLSTTAPNKVYVGSSDLLVSFTRRS